MPAEVIAAGTFSFISVALLALGKTTNWHNSLQTGRRNRLNGLQPQFLQFLLSGLGGLRIASSILVILGEHALELLPVEDGSLFRFHGEGVLEKTVRETVVFAAETLAVIEQLFEVEDPFDGL